MKVNAVAVIVLLLVGAVLGSMLSFVCKPTVASADPTQIVNGRYVPLVRANSLIVVDTQTGMAWREIQIPMGGGTALQGMERLSASGEPE